jgi:hypothetical protein
VRSVRDSRRKALTQASFSSRLSAEVPVPVSVRKTEKPFERTIDNLPDPDPDADPRLVARQDHSPASLIGYQPIDPLTPQRPENRSRFVLAAGKRDDRFLGGAA